MREYFAALILYLLSLPGHGDTGDDAQRLLERVRAQHRAATVVSELRVEIVRPDWKRTLKLHIMEDQERQRYRSKVRSPRKLRGTLFLKAGRRLWMYMPKLRCRVVISPAMMLEPWMGSDLNNQDLLEGDALIDDYRHRVVERREIDGTEATTIESLPRENAAVVWGRLEQRIRDDVVPLEITFYDTHGKAVRRIEFSHHKDFGGHRLPSRWRVVPLPEEGKYTELHVESMAFDIPLPKDAFRALPTEAAH